MIKENKNIPVATQYPYLKYHIYWIPYWQGLSSEITKEAQRCIFELRVCTRSYKRLEQNTITSRTYHLKKHLPIMLLTITKIKLHLNIFLHCIKKEQSNHNRSEVSRLSNHILENTRKYNYEQKLPLELAQNQSKDKATSQFMATVQ